MNDIKNSGVLVDKLRKERSEAIQRGGIGVWSSLTLLGIIM